MAIKWTYEACYEEAKKYKTKRDFQVCCSRGYVVANKNNWLKDYTWFESKCKPNGYWNYETCYEEAKKYISLSDFIKNSATAYEFALKNDWIKDYTWLKIKRKKKGYWTKEKCLEEAKKYNSRLEFYKSNCSAYSFANKNGWLDECIWFKQTQKLPNYWTKEKCLEEAKKYKTIKDFEKGSKGACSSARKNHWIKDYTWFIKLTNFWNYETCYQEAKKYTLKKDFREKSKGAYGVALKNGWIKDYTWLQITSKPIGYWTKERCLEEAKKYNSRGDFCKKNPNVYNITLKKKWINECVWFIPSRKKTPNGYWNYETCYMAAKKCKTRTEFYRRFSGAYDVVMKNGWINDYFWLEIKAFTPKIKLSLLQEVDLHHMSHHQLIELISQGFLPKKFMKLVKSGADTEERQNTINDLKEEAESYINSEDFDEEDDNNDNINEDLDIDNDVSDESEKEITENDLPTDNFIADLIGTDKIIKTTGERAAYLVEDTVSRCWNYALSDSNFISTINTKFTDVKEDSWLDNVLSKFKEEYQEVLSVDVDEDYSFDHAPSLMQKLMVYRLLNNKNYGNWCGTGAGKTNAFLLASRKLDARVTLCVCPNSVIETIDKSIKKIYPKANIVVYHSIDDIKPLDRNQYNYIVFNYEKFQQCNSCDLVKKIVETNKIDFICFDEAHRLKNNNAVSVKTLLNLRTEAQLKNEELRVLGMTATPIINSLEEVKTMLELVKGESFENMFEKGRGGTIKKNITNIHTAYKYLILNGFRFVPKYKMNCKEKQIDILVEDDDLFNNLIKYKNSNVNEVESLLIPYKIKEIIPYIQKGKTILYTEFLKHLLSKIKEELDKNGISYAEYTGEQTTDERKLAKALLKEGNVDVIVASSPISTGVDGLQEFCNTIITLSLPWTNAMYTQLIGRIYRQNSNFKEVNIIIPMVLIPRRNGDGSLWSWDRRRYNIIKTKKTLSDAVVDGVFAPIFNLNKNELLKQAIESLKEGLEDYTVERTVLTPDYSDEPSSQEKKEESVITSTLRKAHTCNSDTLYRYFTENKDAWRNFHKKRDKELEFDAKTVVADTLNKMSPRPQAIIDLGCGNNKLKTMLKYQPKEWISVDYVSDDKMVIQADANDLRGFVDDESMDCAIFCLSLWGRDYLKALDEATRYLKKTGMICVVLPEIDLEESKEVKSDIVESHLKNNGYRVMHAKTDVRGGYLFLWFIKRNS